MKEIILYPINKFISFFDYIGRYFDLMFKIFRSFRSWNIYISLIPHQLIHLGISTFPIVLVTGLFSGMVISVNTAYQLETLFIPDSYVGGVTGITVLLELAPMITGLVMTGRVGATIAAEIGTMRVSEQIDALESLSFDPISFLLMPRIVAGAIMFPVMVILADLFGLYGGYFISVYTLGIESHDFIDGLREWFDTWNAFFGVIKGFFFGITITSIACFIGYHTTGGAQGVGKSTTRTVVVSCISIVILDYILAAILL